MTTVPVPYDEIKSARDNGASIRSQAIRFELNYKVVSRIAKGDVIRERRIISTSKKKVKRELCDCCGIRWKWGGFKHLCRRCYHNHTECGDPLGNYQNLYGDITAI